MGTQIQGFARDLFLYLKKRFKLSPECECDVCSERLGDFPSVFEPIMGHRVYAFSIVSRRILRSELNQVILRSRKPVLEPEDEALLWNFISHKAKKWIQERQNGFLYLLSLISEMYLCRCVILRRHAQCDPCVVYLRSARTCLVSLYCYIMGCMDIGVAVEGIQFDKDTERQFKDVLKKWEKYGTSRDSSKYETPDPRIELPGINALNSAERNKLDFKTINEEDLAHRLGIAAYELVDPLGSDEEAIFDEDLIQIKERYEELYKNRNSIKSSHNAISINSEVSSKSNARHTKPNAEVLQDDTSPVEISNIGFFNPSPTIKSQSSCTIETESLFKNETKNPFEMKNYNLSKTNPESPVKIVYKMILRKDGRQLTTNNKFPVRRIKVQRMISNQQENPVVMQERNQFVIKVENSVALRHASPITMKDINQFTIKDDHPVILDESNPVSIKVDDPVPTKDYVPVTMEDDDHIFMKKDGKVAKDEYPVIPKGNNPVNIKDGDPVTIKEDDPITKENENPVIMKNDRPGAENDDLASMKGDNSVTMTDEDPVSKDSILFPLKVDSPVQGKPITIVDDSPIKLMIGSPVAIKIRSPISKQNYSSIGIKAESFLSVTNDNPATATTESPVKKTVGSPVKFNPECPYALKIRTLFTTKKDNPIEMKNDSEDAVKAEMENNGQAAGEDDEKIEEQKGKIPLFLKRNLTQCKNSAVILQTPTQEAVNPEILNHRKKKESQSTWENITSNKFLDSNKNMKMVEIFFSSSSENLDKSLSEMEDWTETLVVTKRTGPSFTFSDNNIMDETTNSEPISIISSQNVTPVSSKVETSVPPSRSSRSLFPESGNCTPNKSSLVGLNFPMVTLDKSPQVTPEKSPLGIPNRCSSVTRNRSPLERTQKSSPTTSDMFPSANQNKSPLSDHKFSFSKPNKSPIATPPRLPLGTLNKSPLENAQKSSLSTKNRSPLATQRTDPPANLQRSPMANENESPQPTKSKTSVETTHRNMLEASSKFPICSPGEYVAYPQTSPDKFSTTKNYYLTTPSESPRLVSKTYSGGSLPGGKSFNMEVPTPSKSAIPIKSSLIPKETYLPNKQILSISSESEITVFKQPEETPILSFGCDFPLSEESKAQNSSAAKLARDKQQQKKENFTENQTPEDRGNIADKNEVRENKSESHPCNDQAPQGAPYPQEVVWYLTHEILSQHDFRCSKRCSLEYETVFEPLLIDYDNSTRIKAPKVFEVVTYESFSISPLKEYQETGATGDTLKQDGASKTLVNETAKEFHDVVCMNSILNSKLRLIVKPLDQESSSEEEIIDNPNVNIKVGDLDYLLSIINLNSECFYFIRFTFKRLDPESTLPLYTPQLFRLRINESCLYTHTDDNS